MGKILSVTLALAMIFTFTACGGNNDNGSTTSESEPAADNPSNEQTGAPVEQTEESNQDSADENESVEGAKIKLILDNEEVIVNMYDNPTSRGFMAMLPMTLSFEDYVGEEKISYLPRRLSTEPAPSNSVPTVGDFAYFSPWGNLAIFYKDTATAENGLIVLGEIESGKEHLASKSDDFTMTIERMD